VAALFRSLRERLRSLIFGSHWTNALDALNDSTGARLVFARSLRGTTA